MNRRAWVSRADAAIRLCGRCDARRLNNHPSLCKTCIRACNQHQEEEAA